MAMPTTFIGHCQRTTEQCIFNAISKHQSFVQLIYLQTLKINGNFCFVTFFCRGDVGVLKGSGSQTRQK